MNRRGLLLWGTIALNAAVAVTTAGSVLAARLPLSKLYVKVLSVEQESVERRNSPGGPSIVFEEMMFVAKAQIITVLSHTYRHRLGRTHFLSLAELRLGDVKGSPALSALAATIKGGIAVGNLLDALGIDLDLKATPFELEQLGRDAVAALLRRNQALARGPFAT